MYSLSRPSRSSLLLLFLLLIFFLPTAVRGGGGVFQVKRKFADDDHPTIGELLKHDANRHARLLLSKGIDVPLGGKHTADGLYYTEFSIGTPPKNYTLHVDTGSGVLWVNCGPCIGCTNDSSILEKMNLYDPKSSKTARILMCHGRLCMKLHHNGKKYDIKSVCKELEKIHETHDPPCPFSLEYGDGLEVYGSYFTDLVTYYQVTGDSKTEPVIANLTFGCAYKQKVYEIQFLQTLLIGIDGLIGFSQIPSSIISQLASSGKARKIFSHCLDSKKGGGVFAIGKVLKPKVKTTPLIPNLLDHYHVNMKSIQVGNDFLQLPTNLFETGGNSSKGTIIDSGTTMTLLPDEAFKLLIKKIFANHPNLKLNTTRGVVSFNYSGSLKDFPIVTFHFEKSLTLEAQPEQYLHNSEEGMLVGFRSTGPTSNMTIMGDTILSNKLVVYDLEKQTVGWTEYDCSLGIEIEDDTSGKHYKVDEHTIPASKEFCPSPDPAPALPE